MKKILLPALLLISCKSTTAPPLAGAIYVLDSVAGVPLPARYSEVPSVGDVIESDSLALTSTGNGERRTHYVTPEGEHHSFGATFTYTRMLDSIEIVFSCPPGALCIAPPHLAGRLSTSGLTI